MTSPTLFSSTVTAADHAPPTRWMLFLHGILGSGANWRTFARQIVEARPSWGAMLVDLRMHGASQGFSPPHTIRSAAADLARQAAPGPIRAVLGHSFGGKVALAYAETVGVELEHLWVIDANPSAQLAASVGTTGEVLAFLEAVPFPLPSRGAFLDAARSAGLTDAIGAWLAMNLRQDENGITFRLDLAAIRALLEDYLRQDLWAPFEQPRTASTLVVGGRSTSISTDDLARAHRAADAHPETMNVVVLPEAGHWVHVDDPEGLRHVVLETLPH